MRSADDPRQSARLSENFSVRHPEGNDRRRRGRRIARHTNAGRGRDAGPPRRSREGLGDKATQNLLLLTARKRAYSVMVQIYPQNVMKLMTYSSFVIAVLEKGKAIVRETMAKL